MDHIRSTNTSPFLKNEAVIGYDLICSFFLREISGNSRLFRLYSHLFLVVKGRTIRHHKETNTCQPLHQEHAHTAMQPALESDKQSTKTFAPEVDPIFDEAIFDGKFDKKKNSR